MNRIDQQLILELLAEGLEIVTEGNPKARQRLEKWLAERRKTAYADGRQNSWSLERRSKHSEIMRARKSSVVYSMEIYNNSSYGGGLIAQLFFESIDEVAMLMGIRPNSLNVQFSLTKNQVARNINHFDTITRKIPRTDNLEFTRPLISKQESLAELLGRLKLIPKAVQRVAEQGRRGAGSGRPSTKASPGELPLPGSY